MAGKYWWIKERHNPQLGIYYVPCGQLTTKEAKRAEDSLYGTNYMLKFSSAGAYDQKLADLKAKGESVRD